MRSQLTVTCVRCHLEITPSDLRTVYRMADFHRDCFHLLIREEAEEQKRADRRPLPPLKTTGQVTST